MWFVALRLYLSGPRIVAFIPKITQSRKVWTFLYCFCLGGFLILVSTKRKIEYWSLILIYSLYPCPHCLNVMTIIRPCIPSCSLYAVFVFAFLFVSFLSLYPLFFPSFSFLHFFPLTLISCVPPIFPNLYFFPYLFAFIYVLRSTLT